MVSPTLPAIFDGHNDVLTKILRKGGRAAAGEFLTGREGHIDLAKCREGGLCGGFFAIWIPTSANLDFSLDEMTAASYDLPLPPSVPVEVALTPALSQMAILFDLEARGGLRVCRSVAEIEACIEQDVVAAIFHMEGAEAIGPDLDGLEVFYQAGLRSLGPVWSRPTIFGDGVPFRFPSTGDIGPGLTDAGKRLVKRCDELGVMIDLSHLNEAGFWDVAKISSKPLVATHSNAHAICPHSRNLTDKQLDAIAESDGMVGLNFAVAFLRDDGRMVDTDIAQMLRHLDHLISRLGEDRVGFGSDFDGAVVPKEIANAAGLTHLRQAMIDHGYGRELATKLCHGNWMRVLKQTWGA